MCLQLQVVLSNQQSSAADIGQHDEDSQRLEGQIDGFTKELKQCILVCVLRCVCMAAMKLISIEDIINILVDLIEKCAAIC